MNFKYTTITKPVVILFGKEKNFFLKKYIHTYIYMYFFRYEHINKVIIPITWAKHYPNFFFMNITPKLISKACILLTMFETPNEVLNLVSYKS